MGEEINWLTLEAKLREKGWRLTASALRGSFVIQVFAVEGTGPRPNVVTLNRITELHFETALRVTAKWLEEQ